MLLDLTADSEEDEDEQEREFERTTPTAAKGAAAPRDVVPPRHEADASEEEEDDVEDEEEEMAGLVVADAFVASGGPSTPVPAGDEPLQRVRLKFKDNPFYTCPRHPDCKRGAGHDGACKGTLVPGLDVTLLWCRKHPLCSRAHDHPKGCFVIGKRKPPPLLLDANGETLKMNESVLVEWTGELKSLARVTGLGDEPNTLVVAVTVHTEAKPAQSMCIPVAAVSRVEHPPATLRELLEPSQLRRIVAEAGLEVDSNEDHILVAKQLYNCIKASMRDLRHNAELDQIIFTRETELRPKRGSVTRVASYSEKDRRAARSGGGGGGSSKTGPGRACFGAPTPMLDDHGVGGSAFSPVQVPPSLLRLSRTDSSADNNNSFSGREIRPAVGRADTPPPNKAPQRRFGDSVVGGGIGGRVIFGGNIPVRASDDIVAQHAAKRQKILMGEDEEVAKEEEGEEEEEEEEEELEGDLRTPVAAILMEMESGRVATPLPPVAAAVVAAAGVQEAEQGQEEEEEEEEAEAMVVVAEEVEEVEEVAIEGVAIEVVEEVEAVEVGAVAEAEETGAAREEAAKEAASAAYEAAAKAGGEAAEEAAKIAPEVGPPPQLRRAWMPLPHQQFVPPLVRAQPAVQSQSECEFWQLAARMAALPDVPFSARHAFAQQLTAGYQHHGASR